MVNRGSQMLVRRLWITDHGSQMVNRGSWMLVRWSWITYNRTRR